MRNERKYMSLTIMSLLLVGLLLVNCGREFSRMSHAAERQKYEYVALGAKLYTEYCMTCHGPRGEGVVGLTLNRPDLQGDPEDTRFKEVYRELENVLVNGRLGRATPHWVKAEDGRWISYTQMPAWARANGGPLDEHMIKGLVHFIMMGNQPLDGKEGNPTYWELIASSSGPFPAPEANMEGELPDPNPAVAAELGLTQEEVALAKNLIETKLACLACHTIGSKGGKIGPDLTDVGAWVDPEQRAEWEAFLKEWIYDAPGMPNEKRMPNYWYKHRAPGPKVDYSQEPMPPGENNKTFMPSFKKYFDENPGHLDVVVRYLLGLVPKTAAGE